MNTKKVYDFSIIVIMFFGLIWFIGFYLLYMNISIMLDKHYEEKADYILSCYSKCGICGSVIDNDLLYIVEYEKDDYNSNKFLYIKEGYLKEDIFKFRNAFQFRNVNAGTDLLIVFTDILPFFHYIITFSLILGTALFISVIFFFYNQKTKRNKEMLNLISYINNDEMENGGEFSDDDIVELYQAVLKKIGRNSSNEENLNKLIKILQMENNALKSKDSMKTGVIENISHELKSPMTKIKGYLDYLYSEKMGELKDTQKDALLVVRKNVDMLLVQIDQIIKYAKDESFQIEKEIFDIKKLILTIIGIHMKETE